MNWSCSRLPEVQTALRLGHWPTACPAELHGHVAQCPRCSQELLVAQRIQQLRAQTLETAPPGSSSLLWWRAQARRRNAAIERAGRPIAVAQIVALAIVFAIVVAAVASHWPAVRNSLLATDRISDSLATVRSEWGLIPLALALTLIVMLSGIVLYLTTDRHS